MKKIIAGCAVTLIVSGCASTIQKVNESLVEVNSVMQGVTKPMPVQATQGRQGQGLLITEEQQNQIVQALSKKVPDTRMQALITDATPTIKEFIEKVSCLPAGSNGFSNSRRLAVYAASGANLFIESPLNSTPYHNKSACLTVKRIHGWGSSALNALNFEVVYIAQDSGESTKTNHQMVKQPNGAWLFNQ